MATLIFSQIRLHPNSTIEYIVRKDAVLSEKSHDLHNILCYMGEPESVERVYSLSRNCSPNVKLAEQEIEYYRQRYYQSKKGAKPKDGELLGLHFFLSYTVEDNPSVEVMDNMLKKLMEHPLLRDFPIIGANHFDKSHRHTHFYVCQFSAHGKPRKMGLKREELKELKRYANYLCVEHGLSIIDTKALRRDKEYSDWVDNVIAEGKVVVHKEKKIYRRKSKKKVPIKNHYYRWMKENEERAKTEYCLLTDIERKKREFENTYFYTTDGDKNKRWYVSGDPRRRFYAVPICKDGYERSLLELTGLFILAVADNEATNIKRQSTEIYHRFKAEVDKELQGFIDAISTANAMNILTPQDVPIRLADVGKQMNAIRGEKARHERNIADWKSTLMKNAFLGTEDHEELYRRYVFACKKVVDYEKRLKELGKQYHDLKRLEAIVYRPESLLSRIYTYSEEAANNRNLYDVIADAKTRSAISATGANAAKKNIER